MAGKRKVKRSVEEGSFTREEAKAACEKVIAEKSAPQIMSKEAFANWKQMCELTFVNCGTSDLKYSVLDQMQTIALDILEGRIVVQDVETA